MSHLRHYRIAGNFGMAVKTLGGNSLKLLAKARLNLIRQNFLPPKLPAIRYTTSLAWQITNNTLFFILS